MPATSLPLKAKKKRITQGHNLVWKRKIILSREDLAWLAVQGDALFFNGGAGVEAIIIQNGKSLWKMAKGRRSGTYPRVVYDMIFVRRGERSGG
jgi:hypothetical protein